MGYSTLQSRLTAPGQRYFSQAQHSQFPAKSDLSSSTLPHHRIPPPTGFSSSSSLSPRQRNLAHIGTLPRQQQVAQLEQNFRAGYAGHPSSNGPESNI